MRLSSSGFSPQSEEEEKRVLNSELWHACAGPLVSLPAVGSRVVYFPQGHSEQVAASTNKDVDAPIPNYPSLPPQLICQLHNVTMHADVETDEVYAQMTLQPLNPQEQKDPYLPIEMGHLSKQPTNYFCKTLTASDTSTHGGFSVPRRAAEKVFPPLDYSLQPPAQELIARDLHDNEWKFRHIFRGQPKRHLLTTGWSVFVSAKRLVAGDSVLFIWNEKNELLLGVRHANRSQTVMPSSVLSCDSMHLGLLAAAAHAAATNSRFTIFYNPRACPSEFVIPMSKYIKAVYHTRVSVGMRFRMLFETEESSVRRYMGTITGISDLDPNLWPNSHWRSVKVGWDESTAGERQPRVSLWEIEPLTTFPMYPSPFPLRLKRPWPPGLPHFQGVKEGDLGMMSSSPLMWLRGDPSVNFQGMGMTPWLQPRLDASSSSSMFGLQPDMYHAMAAAALQPMEPPKQSPMQQFQNMLQPQILTQLQQPPHQQTSVSSMPMQQPPHQQASVSSMPMQQPPHQLGFSDSTNPLQSLLGSFPSQDDPGNLFRTGPTWPSKRPAIEPSSTMQNSVSLPPFPDGSGDPHSHLLFGVNIDHHHHPSSLMMPNGALPGFRAMVGNGDSTTLPPFTCNYMDPTSQTSDFPLNHHATSMAPSNSGCMDDSGFLQNAEGLENPSAGNFVKVYKSGTFGRSLDITKFSSYNELRSELARMFGLEGLLEDPLRSGWQLVFVDRENDVLLLGDGPWPEFVSSVWCIKILSPQEVHQMDKSGLELLNGSVSRLSNGSCDDFTGRQDSSRSLSTGIPSVGSLDY